MKRIVKGLLLVIVALSLTSCIELIEEMHIHADKSGTWEMRLEANGMQSLLGSVGKYLGEDIVGDWKAIPEKRLKDLKAIKGISNVEVNSSGDFIVGLKFSYKNQRALNKALYALAGYKKQFFYPKLYKVKKHKFKKVDIGKVVHKKLSEELEDMPNKSWMEYVSLTSIYHLPSDQIEVKSSPESAYRLKGNTYTQKHNLLSLSEQYSDLGIKFKY